MNILSTWWFCIFIRSAEFLETIFFILRKKSNQVTFLHVYHHVSSLCVVFIPLKYGQNMAFLIHGIVNAKVHVVMYMYYFLSTFGTMRRFTGFFKPFLTCLQICQLVGLAAHCIYALNMPCLSSDSIVYCAHFMNLSILIFQFMKFYYGAYKSKRE